ncbi:hypothetical protein L2E82_14271 [Cichorium intybus]|uniref:Uncharacterized protein n=1 Tax=Cichorium intybus TaxID=13427 RepID=A0ACB9EZ83_CICIN|nr:hypothetical protein L2E82_14271 [Cichorium intybus]
MERNTHLRVHRQTLHCDFTMFLSQIKIKLPSSFGIFDVGVTEHSEAKPQLFNRWLLGTFLLLASISPINPQSRFIAMNMQSVTPSNASAYTFKPRTIQQPPSMFLFLLDLLLPPPVASASLVPVTVDHN